MTEHNGDSILCRFCGKRIVQVGGNILDGPLKWAHDLTGRTICEMTFAAPVLPENASTSS